MSENNVETGVEIKKTNKPSKILIIIMAILVLGVGGYFGYTKYTAMKAEQKVQLEKAQVITYEVLDESVLNTDILKKWVAENKLSPGVFNTSDEKYTYILISGGKQDTTGYGISLEATKGDLKTITVNYKVIAPENKQTEKKESYPNMVIRVQKDSRTINGEIVK